jgi:hypothetical protein
MDNWPNWISEFLIGHMRETGRDIINRTDHDILFGFAEGTPASETSTVSNAKTNGSVLNFEMLEALYKSLPKPVDTPKCIWYHHDTWKIMSEFVEKIQPNPQAWMISGIPMAKSMAVPFGFVYIEMSSGKVKILDLRKKDGDQ